MGNKIDRVFWNQRRSNAAKTTVKKWSAKDRKQVVTETKCSCNDTRGIFYYISRVIIIHYEAWSDNTSIFMSMSIITSEMNEWNNLNN